MKKLFYTLFLAIFALNLCAHTTYYALNRTDYSTISIETTEDFTLYTTPQYNIYVFEHTDKITISLIENQTIIETVNLEAEDATYIDAYKESNPIFYDFYIVTDFEGNISEKVEPKNAYIDDFTFVNTIGEYKQYKSRFNYSVFGTNRIIRSPKSSLGLSVNSNNKIIFYDKQKETLSSVENHTFTNDTWDAPTSPIVAKIIHTVNNYDIEKFQWVSCPYNAELSITVGSNNTNAVYTFAGDNSYDGTKPAFMLMKYDGTQQNPWVDNMSTTLDAGVGYLLAIDDKGQGNVNASYISTAPINKIKTSITRSYKEYTNANLAEDNNLYLIGSGLFHENIGCEFTNQRFQYFAVPRDDENGYDEHRATGLTSINFIKPHTAVFMQYSGDITFDNSGNVSQNAPSLKRAMEQQIVVEEYNITLAGADLKKKTTILTDELGTEGYTIGEDFLYFHSSPNGDVENQFYTFDADRTLSFNHRANSTQTIQLGGLIAQDGRFTISLEGINTKATSVILTDNVENTFVDLINENYTFDANSGSLDGRFTVTINYAPNTTVDTDVVTNSNGIVVINNIEGCTIENLIAGEQVMIFDAMGRLVYNAQADADFVNVTLNAGTYIVRQNNNWAKFVIK